MRETELQMLRQVYERRRYDEDPAYRETDPVYLQRVQSMERRYLDALRQLGLRQTINQLEVLDFGCGNAKWFGHWLAWGARPGSLHGVDVRESAIASGRLSFPGTDLRVSDGQRLPFPSESMDIVCQNVVFSSMVSDEARHHAAAEILRVANSPCG